MWTLVAALQSDNAPLLTAKASNPLQSKITSDGKLVQGGMPAMPAGGPAMDPEQIRKLLESMGVNPDELQTGSKADDDKP